MSAAPIDPAAIRPGDTGTVRVMVADCAFYSSSTSPLMEARINGVAVWVRHKYISIHEPATRASIAPSPQAESSPERGDDQGGDKPNHDQLKQGELRR
jgi:hypothetical protein